MLYCSSKIAKNNKHPVLGRGWSLNTHDHDDFDTHSGTPEVDFWPRYGWKFPFRRQDLNTLITKTTCIYTTKYYTIATRVYLRYKTVISYLQNAKENHSNPSSPHFRPTLLTCIDDDERRGISPLLLNCMTAKLGCSLSTRSAFFLAKV
ncbi:uncharacterized protein H6S33_007705 [Morchella sextelata]|uniref:uncharacterized protein n=1 Tax=Morchella sextelata TaxID=1174677 RepID=UPI001D036C42|nr:uncharacterized protein H6S33_007705 [Morchella sextelata]KAH0603383.1 hypothetical protein H6S33_007705 [Morchella sextelata]